MFGKGSYSGFKTEINLLAVIVKIPLSSISVLSSNDFGSEILSFDMFNFRSENVVFMELSTSQILYKNYSIFLIEVIFEISYQQLALNIDFVIYRSILRHCQSNN